MQNSTKMYIATCVQQIATATLALHIKHGFYSRYNCIGINFKLSTKLKLHGDEVFGKK